MEKQKILVDFYHFYFLNKFGHVSLNSYKDKKRKPEYYLFEGS